MSYAKVEKTVGKRYPKTQEEMKLYLERVVLPVVEEMRAKLNLLMTVAGIQIATDEADLAELNTTDMGEATLAVVQGTRNLHALNKAGTPGVGDVAASPTGSWDYVMTL